MAAAAAEEEEPVRLSELLDSGYRLLEEVESDTEGSSGAPAIQHRVQRGLELLERAARAVAQLELFSRNEELEEIASADLRFMLVPALLAALTLRQVAPPRRLEHLRRARGLFLDFLRLCRDYAVARFELPREAVDSDEEEHGGEAAPSPSDGQASLLAMAATRRAKIERYKQKKEVENQLASLKPFIDSGQAEEEQIREFYLLQIKKWVTVSLEEIESIDQEIAILNRRGALQGQATQPSQPPRAPVRPFILTRDAAQAKVFGAGYPSLATMTVDEWYDQHQKQGVLPDQGTSQRAPAGPKDQQKEQENTTEEEQQAAALKSREWDDWKDVHPRGYGNRKNMG
ncbi:PREDICTED: immunoglobulin-binding protein 1 isoform X1 [Thamnophis sirtalis]|uniref:immunoglobulin-binding protein 1 isoform X1 n=1 Tax=Thamnophis sirtalis TaxID=35019 RepID=UPI0006B1F6CC|nr:PREDICTED: immunoglobulin-binding protein 1 isoform X1 [Thamnophis sirtalis]